MPDTYASFVLGYGVLWILLFGVMGFTLKVILRLEKDLKNSSSS